MHRSLILAECIAALALPPYPAWADLPASAAAETATTTPATADDIPHQLEHASSLLAPGKFAQALEAFDRIVSDLGDPPDMPSKLQLARAEIGKAIALVGAGREPEGIEIFDKVIARLDASIDPASRPLAARALLAKGSVLAGTRHLE